MSDIDIQLFLRCLIRKLLVPINQSLYLIYFFAIILTELKKQICMKKKIEETAFVDTDLFYFSSIIFKKIRLRYKKQPFRIKMFLLGRTRFC